MPTFFRVTIWSFLFYVCIQKEEQGCPAGFVDLLRKSECICILIIHGCALTHGQEESGGVWTLFLWIHFKCIIACFVFFLGQGALWDICLKASFPPTSSSASFSTGPCHSLLHPSKLTRLLGSPETHHLTDLPTVSPPQFTPSLSALKTPLSICPAHNLRVSLHFSLHACWIFFLACLSPSTLSCILAFSLGFLCFPSSVPPEAAAGEHPAAEQRRAPAARGGHQQNVQAPPASAAHGHAAHCRYACAHSHGAPHTWSPLPPPSSAPLPGA